MIALLLVALVMCAVGGVRLAEADEHRGARAPERGRGWDDLSTGVIWWLSVVLGLAFWAGIVLLILRTVGAI